MRLVTWNVNSLRQRLPRVLEFVEEHAPDVLCLQEKGLGLRIDHALVSEELAARLTRAGIERPYRKGPRPSDHAPLVVEWAD